MVSLPAMSRQIENKAIEYAPNKLNYKIETDQVHFLPTLSKGQQTFGSYT